MSTALVLAHVFAGGIVTVLMFAFAIAYRQQRTIVVEQDAELRKLRRRIALFEADAHALQRELRERILFDQECG